jgi:hypothetical protein
MRSVLRVRQATAHNGLVAGSEAGKCKQRQGSAITRLASWSFRTRSARGWPEARRSMIPAEE